MLTIEQTLAGATDFDGTVGRGLFTFDELELPAALADICPVLTCVSFDNQHAELLEISAFLRPAAAPNTTTIRRVIFEAAAGLPLVSASGFCQDGCKIFVPRSIVGVAGVASWHLIVLTTGKTLPASVTVSFSQGPTQVVQL